MLFYNERYWEMIKRINDLLNNIQKEIKLHYPVMKTSKDRIMRHIGYDKSYLTPYKIDQLSENVYDEIYDKMKKIDIDNMVFSWLRIDVIKEKKDEERVK